MNNYQMLEEFLIEATKGLTVSWINNQNSKPRGVRFSNMYDVKTQPISLEFLHIKMNELKIIITDNKANLYKEIEVSIEHMPNLMSYLSQSETSLQNSAKRYFGESKLNKINNYINEFLATGKLNNQQAVQSPSNLSLFECNSEENKFIFMILPINKDNLGFQEVHTYVSDMQNSLTIHFEKFIPLHEIYNYQFLKDRVKIPYKHHVYERGVDEVLIYCCNKNSPHFSSLAENINLKYGLEHELKINEYNKKIIKI